MILQDLESLKSSSFEHHFEKTLFLTLLASQARILEYQALSISRSIISQEFIILQPRLHFKQKTSLILFVPNLFTFLVYQIKNNYVL